MIPNLDADQLFWLLSMFMMCVLFGFVAFCEAYVRTRQGRPTPLVRHVPQGGTGLSRTDLEQLLDLLPDTPPDLRTRLLALVDARLDEAAR